ncbi:SPOR domain-containing protein [Chenggangzhangella methanolivorans]|uniref:SPOR domain-containing protein n=1 Tax=Chenggangzhangella methanolivorans TaxID=1437009 RepID=A0A9E6RFF9_9HYPH|nr:SPOR domain-containing protein [Chenggangzhangella methanolivorans]QZN99976.1 SPOR domain-containing protein [Chenggangzhangella methanolivorans]
MRNQAVRRGEMAGGRNDQRYDDQQGQWAEDGYELRPGHHYGDDYDRQRYGHAQGEPEPDYDPRAYAPNPEEPYGFDDSGQPLYYQPEPRSLKSGGRSGMLMVGAVLAVAIVGGAGAVGYKMMGSSGFGGEPPLIKADTEPVKSVPDKSAESQQQNKAIYDRVEGGAPAKSKVVSREEEPVDLPRAPASEPRPDGSRIILPGGTASTETTAPSTNGSEPRRVKTVAIRPDQPVAAPQPATPQIPAPQQLASRDPIAETARTGEAPRGSEFDNGIIADGDSPRLAAAPSRPAPQPTPAARPATPPQQQPAPVSRSTAAPAPAPAPQRADPQQVAAVAPRAAAPAGAAAQPRPSAGGFVVQVTSQRSETDARTAYANLQKRYPSVLGPYQPSIQTATVGDRGVYYRVRVGPFGSSSDASTVCNNLRAAGGDCVVARN